MATVRFGKTIEDDEVERDVAKQVRTYVKEMKRTIQKNPKNFVAEKGRRKIFWFLTMLFQHGVFAANQQSKIMTYAQFVFHESKEEEEYFVGLKKLENDFVTEIWKQLYHKMLPNVFAVYHASTETFQVLQTETLEDGSIVRLKNWSRPSLKDWSTTPVGARAELLRWSKGQEWYVCKTNKALTDSNPPIYTDSIHNKSYHFWFLNHMLIWSNYGVYRERRDVSKNDWMKSPMIPVLEFATKQVYPRTNTGFYTFWSETNREAIESVSEAGREEFRHSGQMDDSTNKHIDPRYLRIRTPSPREEDWQSSEDCCHSEAQKRGRGFSDMADSVDEQIERLHDGNTFTQQASIVVLLLLFALWSGSVFMTTLGQ